MGADNVQSCRGLQTPTRLREGLKTLAYGNEGRRVKPQAPLTGSDGIPLRDMWELERKL